MLNTIYNFNTDLTAPTEQKYEVVVTPRSNLQGARNGSTVNATVGVLTGEKISHCNIFFKNNSSIM